MKNKYVSLIVSSFVVFFFLTVSLLPIHHLTENMEKMDSAFSKKSRDVKNLFQDISTVNLLNGLHLTVAQMNKILDLAKKAQDIKQKFLGEHSTAYINTLNKAEKAFKNLFKEIMKGDPAKEGSAVEREAIRSNDRLKQMRDQAARLMTNELSGLDYELSQILSPEQQQVIDTFTPCLIPPGDLKSPVRVGQASSNERGIMALRRIREAPDYAWNHRKYGILGHMIERFSQHRSVMTEEEKEQELERLLALTERVRAMSDTDFELEKENLAEELKPADRFQYLREEMEKRAPYRKRPKASKSVRFLLNERIIPILQEKIKRGGS